MEPITMGLALLGKAVFAKLGIGAAVGSATAAVVGGAVVIAVIGTLVYISNLVLDTLISWFKEKRNLKTSNNHALSVKAELESGKRVYVQGIFDSDGDPVTTDAARTIEYDSASDELETLHEDGVIVEYQ